MCNDLDLRYKESTGTKIGRLDRESNLVPPACPGRRVS